MKAYILPISEKLLERFADLPEKKSALFWKRCTDHVMEELKKECESIKECKIIFSRYIGIDNSIELDNEFPGVFYRIQETMYSAIVEFLEKWTGNEKYYFVISELWDNYFLIEKEYSIEFWEDMQKYIADCINDILERKNIYRFPVELVAETKNNACITDDQLELEEDNEKLFSDIWELIIEYGIQYIYMEG